MRADAFLAALGQLPVADLDTLCGAGGIVVVAPHPDDEALGCGGLMAQACRSGRQVRVVVVSDGCGSHPDSRRYPPPALRDLREAETIRAVGELGLPGAVVSFLRLPDAAVPNAGVQADAAAAVIASVAQACEASAVFVSWEHDPHCDHAASAAIVGLARAQLGDARIFAYPVWGWTLPSDAEVEPAPIGFRLDIGRDRATKRRAILAHVSQTTGLIVDDPGGFRLQEAMIDRLCGAYEHFIEIPR